MKHDDKPPVTPRLRFPEFWNEPGWLSQNLSDLTNVVRGGSPEGMA